MARDDRESFTTWAAERQAALLRTAVLLTGDHQRAEDLVQEVFWAGGESGPNWSHGRSAPSTWPASPR